MAKATAACTCKTCGATFYRYAIKKNSTEARAFEEWAAKNFDECDDCRRKRIEEERAAHAKECAEAAADRGWPELEGSPKQVAWANSIREEKYAEALKLVAEWFRKPATPEEEARKATALQAVEDVMKRFASAKYWIDLQGHGWGELFALFEERANELEKGTAAPEVPKAEQIVCEPMKIEKEGTAEIEDSADSILIRYRKDDDFREIVKSIGYSWDPDRKAWKLPLNSMTGTREDRIAEAGSLLLNRGFRVKFPDAAVMCRAAAADYEPLHTRWIYAAKGSRFAIKWARDGKSDNLYDAAITLPSAKYVRPVILVLPQYWEEVQDFADRFGFRFTQGAIALVETEKAKILRVSPEAVKAETYAEKGIGAETADLSDLIDD